MSPEAINIAIAIACPSVARINARGTPVWKERYEYPEDSSRLVASLFEPYNDLNAMHEAEKVLTDEQLLRRHGHLLNMCGRSLNASRATAAQRAEAFLRTIGKWEDAK